MRVAPLPRTDGFRRRVRRSAPGMGATRNLRGTPAPASGNPPGPLMSARREPPSARIAAIALIFGLPLSGPHTRRRRYPRGIAVLPFWSVFVRYCQS